MKYVIFIILVYKKALSEGERDVAYCRVMLLGPAGAGKSSLKRGLMKLPFDSNIDSTIVANIQSLDFQWATAEWRELNKDDEFDELSRLLALTIAEPTESLYPSLQSKLPLEFVIPNPKEIDKIVAGAIDIKVA